MDEQKAEDSKAAHAKYTQPAEQSGGVNILGGQNTFQGDVVGRDKIDYSVETGLSTAELARLFSPLMQAIEQAPPAQQQPACSKAEALKKEVAKGKQAEDSQLARLVDGIVDLVPGAVSALVGMFAHPVLSGIAGPVTTFVLDKLRGKQ